MPLIRSLQQSHAFPLHSATICTISFHNSIVKRTTEIFTHSKYAKKLGGGHVACFHVTLIRRMFRNRSQSPRNKGADIGVGGRVA